jgi:hypothetical protein
VVVFANRDHAELRHALMLRAFDATLDAAGAPGPRARDWSTDLRALYDSAARLRRVARTRAESLRERDPRPPRPAADYAGTYTDSLYGRASVRAEAGRLVLALSPHLVADLEPRGGDTFLARWRAGWMTPDPVLFTPAAHGRIRRLELGSDGAAFDRSPDRER